MDCDCRQSAPASGLPAFDSIGACPKCGCADVDVKYCVSAPLYSCKGVEEEHMHRKCTRCRYEWLERPLDMAAGPIAVTHTGQAAA